MKTWEETLRVSIQGIEAIWAKFKKKRIKTLSEECKLEAYYNRIYKLSCEPAHITDLIEYMPLHEKRLSLVENKTSKLWAYIALDYGLHVMCEVFQSVSDYYKLGLEGNILGLRDKVNLTRTL